jgi:molecular chaperone DnaK (HSP70)
MQDSDGEPYTLHRTITQEEYGALVMDLVTRTFKVCDEALQQADLTHSDLDGVILVGGPTRLPIVRESVAAYFQRELKDEVDPDAVVAKGAAIHAASLTGDLGCTAHDAFLLDVTPLDLRIGVAGGLAEPVIERNTPVPIEQTRRFTTTRDDQESVQIKVYQGPERLGEANEMLGQFEFSGFRKAPRGDIAIDVTFEINADGIVDVTACDPETQQKASTRLSLSSGLSGGELDQIIEDDKTSRVKSEELAEAAPVAASAPDRSSAEPAAPEPDISELGLSEPELELELGDSADDDELDIGEAAAPSEIGIEFESAEAPAELEARRPEPAPTIADDELGLDSPVSDDLEIDDDQLLALADEVVEEDLDDADTLAQVAADAEGDVEAESSIEPADKHELFETGLVDLSADIEEE